MTSMIAKACSNTSSQMSAQMVQRKGSRSKRKFRADPPLANSNEIMPLQPQESTSFEFSAEKLEVIPNHRHANRCNICNVNQDGSNALKLDLGISCASMAPELGVDRSRDEVEASPNNYHDVDWSELTESHLEELVFSNLGAIFKSAIKKIMASGYSEDVSTNAILRSGLCYGCKDTVSNIVNNTLAFLRGGQEINKSRRRYFDDLEQMKKYVLAELVCLLREVRPFFSTGDAMWCLLISDMDVSHACAVSSYPSSHFHSDAVCNRDSSLSSQSQSKQELKSSDMQIPYRQKFCAANAHNCPSERANLGSACGRPLLVSETTNLANEPKLKRDTSFIPNGLVRDKESQNSSIFLNEDVSEKENQNLISKLNEKPFNATYTTVTEEKIMGSRKASDGMTKKEYILRHKSIHFDKHHHRSNGSKRTLKTGKLTCFGSSFGGQELDKRLKAVADSTGVNAKNPSFNIGSAPQYYKNHNISSSDELASVPVLGLEISNLPSLPKCSDSISLPIFPENTSPSLPVADTELYLSLAVKSIANPTPISYNTPYYGYGGVLNVKSLGKRIPLDSKDEMIMKLVPKVQKLQNQLKEWTEWANQKVMQAARRLSKDKAELKTLRQGMKEVECLKKEKQILEENTMKKLSEIENALFKASGQVEQLNAAIRRLAVENAALRREMEAEKVRTAESAASCEEMLKREKKTLLNFPSWEKQKSILQEELAAEKHKMMLRQQELQQAKDARDQIEAKWHQEKKEKDDLIAQTHSFRNEWEYVEASAKSKEDVMKSKSETNLRKCRDDIERLEKEISRLRLKSDSSKIAALRRGIDSTYASKLTDSENTLGLKDSTVSYVPRVVAASYFQDFSRNGSVKRERECVMCLSDEISVVFLPCAHQVVCMTCNELHEKQGMKDCPSCRSQIQRRVCVHYARP